MSFAIRCEGLVGVNVVDSPTVTGSYLQSYDPDANGGRGDAVWTNDPANARRFDSPVDAWECWRQTSTVQPLRADGKPNRPLTAFTVTIEPVG